MAVRGLDDQGLGVGGQGVEGVRGILDLGQDKKLKDSICMFHHHQNIRRILQPSHMGLHLNRDWVVVHLSAAAVPRATACPWEPRDNT